VARPKAVTSPDGRWRVVQYHDSRRGRERLRLYRLGPSGVPWLRGYYGSVDELPDEVRRAFGLVA
jgi:hypothetical protein